MNLKKLRVELGKVQVVKSGICQPRSQQATGEQVYGYEWILKTEGCKIKARVAVAWQKLFSLWNSARQIAVVNYFNLI